MDLCWLCRLRILLLTKRWHAPREKFGVSFNKIVKPKRGETIVFSWIVYKSRAHRDKVNAQVMSDPQIKKAMEKGPMPFDVKRMAYGGFKFLVEG